MTIANVPMPRLPSTGCGFSLFEIMITLAVASVLMTVAVPYLGGFVRDVRLKSVGNAFIGDMHFARSEAVKRNARITLRPTSNPDTDLCANAAPGDVALPSLPAAPLLSRSGCSRVKPFWRKLGKYRSGASRTR